MIAPQDYASTFFSKPDTQTLAQAAIPQADQERKREMQDAWKAYRGKLQDPLKVGKDQPNDNVKSNRCAPIVDKGVSFLFGQVLKIEAADQDFIDGLWGDDDDKMTKLSNMATNGGVCGQNFVKLIPAQGQMKFPRLVVMDPLVVRIVTPPDDCELVLAYVIEYPGTNDLQKRQIIARVDPDNLAGIAGEYDLDDTWTITNYMRKGQAGAWFQVGTPEVWPYPFAPIFCNQNLPNPNEPWGAPDLSSDIIEMNKVLNFVQSNTSRIIKFHAHPKTWGKGFKASQMSVAVDEVLVIEAPDGTLQNLEMTSNLQSSLGFAGVLRSDMDEQSRVPAVALGRLESLPRGNISGVALQLLFQPLLEKTIQKQRLYGKLIREISRAALVMAGRIGIEQWEDYKINIHWQNLLPIDDLAAAQTAQILLNIGVSGDTVLKELGYNSQDEAKKKAKENAVKVQQAQAAMPPNPMQQQPPVQQQQESPFMVRGQ